MLGKEHGIAETRGLFDHHSSNGSRRVLDVHDRLDYGVHVWFTSSQLTSLYDKLQALLYVLLVQLITVP